MRHVDYPEGGMKNTTHESPTKVINARSERQIKIPRFRLKL